MYDTNRIPGIVMPKWVPEMRFYVKRSARYHKRNGVLLRGINTILSQAGAASSNLMLSLIFLRDNIVLIHFLKFCKIYLSHKDGNFSSLYDRQGRPKCGSDGGEKIPPPPKPKKCCRKMVLIPELYKKTKVREDCIENG